MLLGWAKMLPESNQFGAQYLSKVATPVGAHLETHPHMPAKMSATAVGKVLAISRIGNNASLHIKA